MTNDFLTTEELCGFTEEGYEDELWGLIPGYENYYVSTKGRVWSSSYGYFLKPGLDGCGYLTVALCSNGEQRTASIHRLIAEQFIANPYNYPVVRHLNDVKTDNRLENLAWGTQSQNIYDAVKNGGWDDKLRPVIAINNDTGIGYYYSSCSEAAMGLGYSNSAITQALRDSHNVGGYRIIDADPNYLHEGIQSGEVIRHLFSTRKMKRPKQSTKILCTRCDNGEQLTFNNIIETITFFGSSYGAVTQAIYQKSKHKDYYIEYDY